jgi:hypothetical protein
MTERRHDGPRGEVPVFGTHDERLAGLAAIRGLEGPPFDRPLVAFDPAPDGAPGDPVYLGGDLHRVRPEVSDHYPGRRRDRTLDRARIALYGHQHENHEVTAVEGVWCLALHGDLVDSAPYSPSGTRRDVSGPGCAYRPPA